MKYLMDYTQDLQTKVFNEFGAFFAYSQKQFDEQARPSVEYVNLSSGFIAPKEGHKELLVRLKYIQKEGIRQDKSDHSQSFIIKRELANHEYQFTLDLTDTLDALQGYDFDKKSVIKASKEYLNYCVEHDTF